MNEIRQAAKNQQEKFFILPKKSCPRGHFGNRYVSNGRCVECHAEDAISSTVVAAQKRYYERTKIKRIAQSRKWKQANRRKVLGYKVKAYGITVEQYEAMLVVQNNCCAICKSELDMGRHTHVDHCHDTGKVRGVLCSKCNSAIGYLRNSPFNAFSAAQYLRSTSL